MTYVRAACVRAAHHEELLIELLGEVEIEALGAVPTAVTK